MMGWLVIFIIPAIVTKTGPVFWGLMLAGGLSYTVGAAFTLRKTILPHDLAPLHHAGFSTPISGYRLLHASLS